MVADLSKLKRYDLEESRFSCIYFLWSESELVYIGQCVDGLSRVLTHARDPEKEFDSYSYIRVDKKDLNRVEADHILHYQPKYNKSLTPTAATHFMGLSEIKELFFRCGFTGYSMERFTKHWLQSITETVKFDKCTYYSRQSVRSVLNQKVKDAEANGSIQELYARYSLEESA